MLFFFNIKVKIFRSFYVNRKINDIKYQPAVKQPLERKEEQKPQENKVDEKLSNSAKYMIGAQL